MQIVKTILSKFFSLLVFKISLPLFLQLLVLGGVFYVSVSYIRTNPEPFGLIKGPSIIKEEEDKLIKKVGALINLPSDERPTVATVSDKEKVKDQPFFGQAQNGDKVLVYTTNKKVILFRPSEDRVIEVGTVNINQQVSASPTPASEVKSKETSAPDVEN